MSNQVFTNEDTINLLLDKAKVDGDRFILRIYRRKGMSGIAENYATLGDATALHIQSPETWLPMLMGGGEFGLEAAHAAAPAQRIGGRLHVSLPGAPMQLPDPRAFQRADWSGPPTAVYLAGNGAALGSVLPSGYTQTQQQAQQSQGVTMTQGNGAPMQALPQTVYTTDPSYIREKDAELQRRERELHEMQARITREQAEKEAALRRLESETRIKSEMEQQKRELDAKIAALAAAPKEGGVEKILTVITPLVGTFLQLNAQARTDAMKMQLEAQERAERRAEAQAAETRRLIEAMGQKPGMSDETKLLIEVLKSQGSGQNEMMSRYVEAMGMVSKQSVSMIEAIAEINLGAQPEHPMMLAIREGVSALRAMTAGASATARPATKPQALPSYAEAAKSPVPAPQQLPAPVPAPVAAAQPAQVPVTHFAGIDPKSGNGAVAVQTPSTLPPQQAAPASPQVTVPVFNIGPDDDPVAMLEAAIRAHDEPNKVAMFFIQSLKHPRMNAALEQFGGDPTMLLGSRLGPEWLGQPANAAYVAALGEVIDRLGVQYGLVEAEDDGEDEVADEA